MRNPHKAHVVKLDIGTGVWYATTIGYETINAHNGCFMIWDEKKQEIVEYRAAETGSKEHCEAYAAKLNKFR